MPFLSPPRFHTFLHSIAFKGKSGSVAYERLSKYIKDFEAELDNDHEIGARLVSFGQNVTFHIEDIGYYGPDIITFDGRNDAMEKVQLIQHVSQLSVLLVAVRKQQEEPRRIGFILDKEKSKSNP
jgi:hypothetical protein